MSRVDNASKLRLPRLISDGMVLQKDENINIWGWAKPEEKVIVKFLGTSYSTVTNNDGKWCVVLPPQKPGGPYTMEIQADRSIFINDVLIGDVWVCSGQSNMELPMERVSELYTEDIALSYNLFIRLFNVPIRFDFLEAQDDLQSGRWEFANPVSVLHFNATGYFFAKALFERYHVPIGLINTSAGGSPVEAWLSEESLKKFPKYKEISDECKDLKYIDRTRKEDEARNNSWYEYIYRMDKGLAVGDEWYREDYDDSEWQNVNLPSFWEDEGLGRVNGVVWFRKEIYINSEIAGKAARLLMGRIVDSDTVYVNGLLVGTTGYQYPPRRYAIPGNVLKEGKNIITVRVVNNSGKGGFIKDKPYKIMVDCEKTVDLTGTWKCKIGAVCEPLEATTFFQYKPLGLFNGMLSPLISYTIKGFIWYQGESNTWRAWDYKALFAELINDWRNRWNQGNLPFFYVQLPNYMEVEECIAKNGWPEIREAQLKTLDKPKTGMAVTIDVGEWNDLHPLNKKTIGNRLALLARRLAYGEDLICSGPIYDSAKVDGSKMIITFKNGSGELTIGEGEELKGFEVAGIDLKYVNAEAYINNNKVIVWNKDIDNPSAVRYAWSDNPVDANLYNKEGLPASPFRSEPCSASL